MHRCERCTHPAYLRVDVYYGPEAVHAVRRGHERTPRHRVGSGAVHCSSETGPDSAQCRSDIMVNIRRRSHEHRATRSGRMVTDSATTLSGDVCGQTAILDRSICSVLACAAAAGYALQEPRPDADCREGLHLCQAQAYKVVKGERPLLPLGEPRGLLPADEEDDSHRMDSPSRRDGLRHLHRSNAKCPYVHLQSSGSVTGTHQVRKRNGHPISKLYWQVATDTLRDCTCGSTAWS